MSPDFWIGVTIGAFAVICAVIGIMIYSTQWTKQRTLPSMVSRSMAKPASDSFVMLPRHQ